MGRSAKRRGQTATEYMLATSVVAIAIATAFWLIFSSDGNAPDQGGPAQKSFKNLRETIEKPYP